MDTKKISKLRDKLARVEDIVVVAHTNPDGDALGSSLAMLNYLLKKGKRVEVIVPNAFPDFLAWLPGIRNVLNWELDEDRCRALINKAGIIFCMDFNALHRLDGMEVAVSRANAFRVLVDHHISPSDEFQLMFSDTGVSSTCELVYQLVNLLGDVDRIDPDIAICLFVGIMTDTGSFSYACGHPQTFRIAADLIARGVDPEKVHRLVYDTYSEQRMRLLGYSLGERMKVMEEFHTAYIYLTAEDLIKFQFRNGDTEGLVNYPLSISGINLSVLFTEKADHIRMSLRSKGDFSVNKFVRDHFEGGGHRNAAGGNSFVSMQDTLKKFEALLPEYRDALRNSKHE